ncbi:hypothetical protein SSX86_026628 [Deinandra increscens subsp. villosa]|uniref:DUF7036 domain-containing protein n=1 Tax=Deinandra increscens subsp. villosa TaxID=3103831 RepID=A0AAP0GPC2_9ASTR
MGKGDQQHPSPPTIPHSQSTAPHADTCSCCTTIARLFRFKCLFVLLLALSILLSAVFWLPPFFRRGDHGDLDLDSRYKGHDIVATFMIQKPLSLLQDDFPRLGEDIFDEIRVRTTKACTYTPEKNDRSNTTKVIFGVDPDESDSNISSYARSLVRESFVSLILKQSPLRLTDSLFGEPSSFEVLKFVGGITVTPDQSTYPLQEVQIRFNFTLNFPIQQILDHFGELTSQLKSGLHLGPYENLHVSLTNSKGSTVAPRTTVQSSVVLVIGTPSKSRSKQLAQTIKGSPTQNLGLNNTQFGRVKQISLSSSFNSSSGGGRGTMTPSPAPQPAHHNHHHHHYHHHHHHHHHDKQLPPAKPPSPSKHSPAPPPVPTSAPHNIHTAKPPDCHSGCSRKKKNPNKQPPLSPPVSQPVPSPHTYLPPPLPNLPQPPRLPPSSLSPHPPPPVTELIPASGPLPNVVFAHTHPPSKSDSDAAPPDMSPSGSSLQPSCKLIMRYCKKKVSFLIMHFGWIKNERVLSSMTLGALDVLYNETMMLEKEGSCAKKDKHALAVLQRSGYIIVIVVVVIVNI